MDENDPINDDEFVLRRVVNLPDYYDPTLPAPTRTNAFRPTDDDLTGISVYREAFVSAEAVARAGGSEKGYYVARLPVAGIRALGLTVTPDPQPDLLPGHSLVPEINCIRYKIAVEKKRIKPLQERLARLADANIVLGPDGYERNPV